MGRAVVRHLGPSGVAVYSRRSEPVADVPSHPWEGLPEALASCQAVISTVPGPVPVLQEVRRPEGSPLMVIDLGMPPAMQPESSAVTYHGVDDVAASVPMTTEPEAEHRLALASAKAWGRLTVSSDASALIASLVEIVDRTVDDEVLRFAGRFPPGIEESVLRQMAHTVARRIIHPSVSLLGSSPLTHAELELLAKALGVERD